MIIDGKSQMFRIAPIEMGERANAKPMRNGMRIDSVSALPGNDLLVSYFDNARSIVDVEHRGFEIIEIDSGDKATLIECLDVVYATNKYTKDHLMRQYAKIEEMLNDIVKIRRGLMGDAHYQLTNAVNCTKCVLDVMLSSLDKGMRGLLSYVKSSVSKKTEPWRPDEYLEHVVKRGNVTNTRLALISLLMDSSHTWPDVEKSFRWADANINNLTDSYSENNRAKPISRKKRDWTPDYYRYQEGYLRENFSETRWNHLIEVIKYLVASDDVYFARR